MPTKHGFTEKCYGCKYLSFCGYGYACTNENYCNNADKKEKAYDKANVDNANKEYWRGYREGKQEILDKYAELEKQGEHSIYNVPSREVILAIWDLGNEWKELTNGSISTEYGTQLDYIQKHWHESEYYLREKQREQKPKFKVGDILVSEEEDRRHIYKIDAITNYDTYLLLDLEDGYTRNESVYTTDLAMYLWTIEDARPGDVLTTKAGSIFIYKELLYDKPFAYCGVDKFGVFKDCNCGNGLDWTPYLSNVTPATKEQHNLLFAKMKETGYEWDAEKKKLNNYGKNKSF